MERYGRERAERRKAHHPGQEIAPRRGRAARDVLFRELRHDVAQVHEMLHIERGGEAQIADELRAYNPLIPQKGELVATLMFEIEDEVQRGRVLRQLTNIEETAYLDIGGEKIKARFETDVERTAADGKTSSVHFLRFKLNAGAGRALPRRVGAGDAGIYAYELRAFGGDPGRDTPGIGEGSELGAAARAFA